MLDKILNIKASLQYQKEKGILNNPERHNLEKLLSGTAKHRSGIAAGNDSIMFSPGAHFLARINWQLKDLAFDAGGDKLSIAFSIGGYDFHTEIDFLKFHLITRQFYEIKAFRQINNKNVTAQMRISAAKKSKLPKEEKTEVNFPGLDGLFSRVYSLGLSGEIDKYYSSALRELMDGIKETLIGEFDYINAALFTLVDRIAPGKIAPNYVFNDEKNEPIIIENIKVLND